MRIFRLWPTCLYACLPYHCVTAIILFILIYMIYNHQRKTDKKSLEQRFPIAYNVQRLIYVPVIIINIFRLSVYVRCKCVYTHHLSESWDTARTRIIICGEINSTWRQSKYADFARIYSILHSTSSMSN